MPFNMARKRPAPQSDSLQKSLVGTEIDTRCRACKATTKHVVTAKVGSKPSRVRCGTCELEHEYSVTRPRRNDRLGPLPADRFPEDRAFFSAAFTDAYLAKEDPDDDEAG